MILLAASVRAQTNAGQSPFPILPLIVEYEYVPQYFLQWINDDPQYSMIEALVGRGEQPIYQVVMTEKSSSRRVYYSNSEAKVKELSGRGLHSRLAKIDFRTSSGVGQQSSYGFAFRDERGTAILWRFIPATEASERGAGLTPQYGGEGLQLRYRELATAAGAGSAVQIGDRVNEAEPWPEISAPPYFVAHRGSYVEGMHVGFVLPGTRNWRITSSPADLIEGAQWTITDGGAIRQFRIAARKGDELTIVEEGAQPSPPLIVTARISAGGLALRSISAGREKRAMRISFKPELDLSALSTDKKPAEVSFQIDLGSHEKVARGEVIAEARGDHVGLRWQPQSPDWAKGRAITTTIIIGPAGYKIDAR
jgi:hypothetical protein